MNNFFNNINWIIMLKAFIVGGLICVIGQILIDKTRLTPARILVVFVTVGTILRRYWNLSKANRLCRSWCNSSSNWFWKSSS